MRRLTSLIVSLAVGLGTLGVHSMASGQLVLGTFLLFEAIAVQQREAFLKDPCFTMADPRAAAARNPLNPMSGFTLNQRTLIDPLQPADKMLIQRYTPLAEALLDDYRKLASMERAYRLMSRGRDGQRAAQIAQQFKGDQEFVKMQLRFMPGPGGSFTEGEAGGYCRIYACRIKNWVERPVYGEHMARIKEMRGRMAAHEEEARAYLAQGVQGGISIEDFSVFRAGNDVLVGQLDSVRKIKACDLAGWGLDCTKTVGELVSVTNAGPNFPTAEAAREWYCGQMEAGSARVVPLTGGRDRQAKFKFSGGQYLNIQNAPSCASIGVSNTGPWRGEAEAAPPQFVAKEALQVCR